MHNSSTYVFAVDTGKGQPKRCQIQSGNFEEILQKLKSYSSSPENTLVSYFHPTENQYYALEDIQALNDIDTKVTIKIKLEIEGISFLKNNNEITREDNFTEEDFLHLNIDTKVLQRQDDSVFETERDIQWCLQCIQATEGTLQNLDKDLQLRKVDKSPTLSKHMVIGKVRCEVSVPNKHASSDDLFNEQNSQNSLDANDDRVLLPSLGADCEESHRTLKYIVAFRDSVQWNIPSDDTPLSDIVLQVAKEIPLGFFLNKMKNTELLLTGFSFGGIVATVVCKQLIALMDDSDKERVRCIAFGVPSFFSAVEGSELKKANCSKMFYSVAAANDGIIQVLQLLINARNIPKLASESSKLLNKILKHNYEINESIQNDLSNIVAQYNPNDPENSFVPTGKFLKLDSGNIRIGSPELRLFPQNSFRFGNHSVKYYAQQLQKLPSQNTSSQYIVIPNPIVSVDKIVKFLHYPNYLEIQITGRNLSFIEEIEVISQDKAWKPKIGNGWSQPVCAHSKSIGFMVSNDILPPWVLALKSTTAVLKATSSFCRDLQENVSLQMITRKRPPALLQKAQATPFDLLQQTFLFTVMSHMNTNNVSDRNQDLHPTVSLLKLHLNHLCTVTPFAVIYHTIIVRPDLKEYILKALASIKDERRLKDLLEKGKVSPFMANAKKACTELLSIPPDQRDLPFEKGAQGKLIEALQCLFVLRQYQKVSWATFRDFLECGGENAFQVVQEILPKNLSMEGGVKYMLISLYSNESSKFKKITKTIIDVLQDNEELLIGNSLSEVFSWNFKNLDDIRNEIQQTMKEKEQLREKHLTQVKLLDDRDKRKAEDLYKKIGNFIVESELALENGMKQASVILAMIATTCDSEVCLKRNNKSSNTAFNGLKIVGGVVAGLVGAPVFAIASPILCGYYFKSAASSLPQQALYGAGGAVVGILGVLASPIATPIFCYNSLKREFFACHTYDDKLSNIVNSSSQALTCLSEFNDNDVRVYSREEAIHKVFESEDTRGHQKLFDMPMMDQLTQQSLSVACSWISLAKTLYTIRNTLSMVATIGFFGRKRIGKSHLQKSLWPRFDIVSGNFITEKTVVPRMRSLPSSPTIQVIDFPGYDEESDAIRGWNEICLEFTSVIVFVIKYNSMSNHDIEYLTKLTHKGIPFLVCVNWADQIDTEAKLSYYKSEQIRAIQQKVSQFDASKLWCTCFYVGNCSQEEAQTKFEQHRKVGICTAEDVRLWIALQIMTMSPSSTTWKGLLRDDIALQHPDTENFRSYLAHIMKVINVPTVSISSAASDQLCIGHNIAKRISDDVPFHKEQFRAKLMDQLGLIVEIENIKTTSVMGLLSQYFYGSPFWAPSLRMIAVGWLSTYSDFKIGQKTLSMLVQTAEGNWETYLSDLRNSKIFEDDLLILAIANLFDLRIILFKSPYYCIDFSSTISCQATLVFIKSENNYYRAVDHHADLLGLHLVQSVPERFFSSAKNINLQPQEEQHLVAKKKFREEHQKDAEFVLVKLFKQLSTGSPLKQLVAKDLAIVYKHRNALPEALTVLNELEHHFWIKDTMFLVQAQIFMYQRQTDKANNLVQQGMTLCPSVALLFLEYQCSRNRESLEKSILMVEPDLSRLLVDTGLSLEYSKRTFLKYLNQRLDFDGFPSMEESITNMELGKFTKAEELMVPNDHINNEKCTIYHQLWLSKLLVEQEDSLASALLENVAKKIGTVEFGSEIYLLLFELLNRYKKSHLATPYVAKLKSLQNIWPAEVHIELAHYWLQMEDPYNVFHHLINLFQSPITEPDTAIRVMEVVMKLQQSIQSQSADVDRMFSRLGGSLRVWAEKLIQQHQTVSRLSYPVLKRAGLVCSMLSQELAETFFSSAINYIPDDPVVYYYLGKNYSQRGMPQAAENFIKALHISIFTRRPLSSDSLTTIAKFLKTQTSTDLFVRVSDTYPTVGSLFERAVKQEPTNTDVVFEAAYYFTEAKQADKAEIYVNMLKKIESASRTSALVGDLAQLKAISQGYLETYKYLDEAIKNYKIALGHSQDPRISEKLAHLYVELDQYEFASLYFQITEKLDSSFAVPPSLQTILSNQDQAKALLVIANNLKKNTKYGSARTKYQQALDLFPDPNTEVEIANCIEKTLVFQPLLFEEILDEKDIEALSSPSKYPFANLSERFLKLGQDIRKYPQENDNHNIWKTASSDRKALACFLEAVALKPDLAAVTQLLTLLVSPRWSQRGLLKYYGIDNNIINDIVSGSARAESFSSFVAYCCAGFALERTGKLQKAIMMFQTALIYNPKSKVVSSLISRLKNSISAIFECEQLYISAIKKGHKDAALKLARLAELQGDWYRATEIYQQTTNQLPPSIQIKQKLYTNLLHRYHQYTVSSSVVAQQLEHSLQIPAEECNLLMFYLENYDKQYSPEHVTKLKKRISQLQQILKTLKTSVNNGIECDGVTSLGFIRERLGQFVEATECFELCLKADPSHEHVYNHLRFNVEKAGKNYSYYHDLLKKNPLLYSYCIKLIAPVQQGAQAQAVHLAQFLCFQPGDLESAIQISSLLQDYTEDEIHNLCVVPSHTISLICAFVELRKLEYSKALNFFNQIQEGRDEIGYLPTIVAALQAGKTYAF